MWRVNVARKVHSLVALRGSRRRQGAVRDGKRTGEKPLIVLVGNTEFETHRTEAGCLFCWSYGGF